MPGIRFLGDGKYGKLDPHADRRYQALYSYRLTFCFTTGLRTCVPERPQLRWQDVEFVKTYFPAACRELQNKANRSNRPPSALADGEDFIGIRSDATRA